MAWVLARYAFSIVVLQLVALALDLPQGPIFVGTLVGHSIAEVGWWLVIDRKRGRR